MPVDNGFFVIVSGLPGSGKSTLASGLAPRLSLPLLDKDVVLRSLFDSISWGTDQERETLSRAGDAAMLALALDNGAGVLVNWWHHDTAPRQLAALGSPLVQVFCDCPAAVAAQRFRTRRRHPGHLDPELSDAQFEARVAHITDTFAGPLQLSAPLVAVDTTGHVDLDDLTSRFSSLTG